MKNKKGFTLIELLAVIAILALIIVIALPNVMRYLNQSKKDSYMTEVRGIVKAAENQWMNDSMVNQTERVYSKCNNDSCTNPLSLSGRSNIEYYVKMDKTGKIVKFAVKDGTFQYFYYGMGLNVENINEVKKVDDLNDNQKIRIINSDIEEAKHIVEAVDSSCTKTTPGCEVKLGSENFYVVSSNSNETILLAKYDLSKITGMQDTSGISANIIKTTFADIGYWDGCKRIYNGGNRICTSSPSGLLSPYKNGGKRYCHENQTQENCSYVYDSNTSFYDIINNYASSVSTENNVSITGRLLSLEEANGLDVNVRKDNNGSIYWLGSAKNVCLMWSVQSSGSTNILDIFVSKLAIRPVLVINTSSL